MKDLFIKGNLHLPNDKNEFLFLADQLTDSGITIHVKGDVYFHNMDDDFIFSKDDRCIENIFTKYKIKDIIAYSTHEKLK